MCKKNDSFLSDFHFNIEYFTWYVSLNIEYLDFDVIFATATLKSTLIKRESLSYLSHSELIILTSCSSWVKPLH